MQPLAAPEWLPAALDADNPAGLQQLYGRQIIFNWGDGDGGWAVGALECNVKNCKINRKVANFVASYAVDDSKGPVNLTMDNYASSSNAPEEAWCLIGKPDVAAPLLLTHNGDDASTSTSSAAAPAATATMPVAPILATADAPALVEILTRLDAAGLAALLVKVSDKMKKVVADVDGDE